MLIGYVSDEDYSALADVVVDFEKDGKLHLSTRSTATGAVLADLESGEYRVSLVKAGYGSKRVTLNLTPHTPPYPFRLLSDTLLGYMSPKWVHGGERAEFRVHSVHPYRLSLYRYGLQKEFIRLIGWYDAHGARTVMQITPDGDYSQTGVDWNRIGWGSLHHTQYLTAPSRSGLYYLHAETDRGEFFAFPWIVAPPQPTAKVAVLCATNTWNAYNRFGGRSNYVNARHLPATPTVNSRQDLQRYQGGTYDEWAFPDSEYQPLSFDRPEPANHIPKTTQVTDPIEGRDACHLAPAEWRLLAWLEREGYAYDLYSEAQLHDGTLNLETYKVLLLPPHPEYWSRQMFERVQQWVDSGGRLMYLGGNGLNCEVEFTSENALVFRSQMPQADEEYESRLHRRVANEASLLGVRFTEAGIMTAAPYAVHNANHWCFEGTGLMNGDTFGEHSLHERIPGGASGHETDKRSPLSPPQTALLARGLNPEEGGAEMVFYELESGGSVFSVGSITYCASLLVDEHTSQITRNVLERFLRE